MKTIEESRYEALNAVAHDLLQGKEVRLKTWNGTGFIDTYGTPDGRKIISMLRLDYGFNISDKTEPNRTNNGRHKVYFLDNTERFRLLILKELREKGKVRDAVEPFISDISSFVLAITTIEQSGVKFSREVVEDGHAIYVEWKKQ